MIEKWRKVHGLTYRVFSAFLSVLMVFTLVQPGLGFAVEYTCGLEEHTHGDDCYGMVPEQRTVRMLNCGFDIEAAYADVQGEAVDFVVHAHEDACFGEDGHQLCPLKEILPHEHTGECYAADMAPQCGLEEGEDHTHSDACALTCGEEEIILHTHDLETCYAEAEQEETQPAEAGEDQPAAEGEPVLTCTAPVVYEHIHDGACFTETVEEVEVKTLICKLSEHTHDKTCEAEEDEPEPEAPTVTEEPAATTESTESTEGESVYEAYLQTLAALEQQVKVYLALSPEAADFAAQEIALYENLDKMEARLWSDLSAAVLTMEEFTELNDEFARISDLLYVDFEPEEEISSYAETYTIGYINDESRTDYYWEKDSTGYYAVKCGTTDVYAYDALLQEADGSIYYVYPEGEDRGNGYMAAGVSLTINEIDYTFGADGVRQTAYGPMNGTGDQSAWDYYWHDDDLYEAGANTLLTTKAAERSVKARYSSVVLGENSAVNVECHIPDPSLALIAGNVSDADGVDVGLQDCVDALVNAGKDSYSTIAKKPDGSDYFWVMYHNIGTDVNGNPICLSLSLYDYAIHTKQGVEPRIGFTTNKGVDGNKVYVKDNAPGVSVTNISWLTEEYQFYTHEESTAEEHTWSNCEHTSISVQGSTSYYDVDGWQGVHLDSSNKGLIAIHNNSDSNAKMKTSQLYIDYPGSQPYVYCSQYTVNGPGNDTGYTTSHGFTEEFDTESGNSFKRTFVFNGSGGIYHDAQPVVPTGSIEVTKSIASERNTSFNISVSLSGGQAGKTIYYAYPGNASGETTLSNDGSATITASLKHGQKLLITGIPEGTQYSVTEDPGQNYASPQITKNDSNDTVSAEEHVKVTVTNSRAPATVTVKKQVSGTYDGSTKFPFKAWYVDNGVTYNLNNGVVFYLGKDETKTFSVPLGATFYAQEQTLTCTVGSMYSANVTTEQSLQVSASGGTLTFTNTRKTAAVTVKKTVTNPSSNPNASFSFTATLKDTNGTALSFPQTPNGVTLSNNNKTATFSLKNDGNVKFENLPAGSVLTVTESTGNTYKINSSQTQTATAGTNSEITFNNTLQGKLTVKKVIAGPSDGSNFTINTTVGTDKKPDSFSHNTEKTYGPYDAGMNFTVAESAAYGYQVTYSPSATGTINNATQTVTVRNEGLTTSVNIPISKTLVNPDGTQRTYEFKLEPMTVNGVTAPGSVQTLTLDATDGSDAKDFTVSLDTSHLKGGTVGNNQKTMKYYYKVYESTQSVDGTLAADTTWYKVEVTLTGTVDSLKAEVTNIQEAGSGDKVNATFTNTLLGSLKVTKKLTDGSTDQANGFPITVTLSGDAYRANTSYTYQVNNETKTTLTDTSGNLKIELKLSGGKSATITGVPYGGYEVEEQVPHGYAVSYDGKESGNLTVGTTKPVETVVTNTEKTTQVKLGVQKNMAYPDKLNANTFTFNLTVHSNDTNNTNQAQTVTVNQNVASAQIPSENLFVLNYKGSQLGTTGTATFLYTITEQVTSEDDHIQEDTTQQKVTVVLTQNQATRELLATVTPDNKQVSFTNVLNGNLTIVKDVLPRQGSYAEDRTFTIHSGIDGEDALSLKDKDQYSASSSHTYTKPIGTAFTVTETLVYGYQTSYAVTGAAVTAGEITTSDDKVEGKIAVGDTTVTVTNAELTASQDVEITKHVTNPDGKARTYSFTIEALEGAPGLVGADDEGKKVVQVTVPAGDESKTETFANRLSYSGRDLAGEQTKTFQYKITENATDDKLNQYDKAEFIMSVTLTHTGDCLAGTNEDENKDALVTSVSYSKGQETADSISFTNTTLGSLKIIKDLNLLDRAEDADKETNRDFVFDIEIISKDYTAGKEYLGAMAEEAQLSDGTDAGKITITRTIQASHNEDGYAQIDGIPVNSEFKVTEQLSSSFGYEVDYNVSDVMLLNRLAQLFSAKPTCAEGTINAFDKDTVSTVTVTNKELETNETVSITKDIVNPDGNERSLYFKLIETDGEGNVKSDGVTRKVQVKMKDDETISFEPIPYRGTDLEDSSSLVNGDKKTRDYYYKVFEIDQTAYASDAIEDETIADNKEVDSDQDYYLVKVTLTATLNKLEAHVVEVIDADKKTVMEDAENPLLKPDFQNILLGTLKLEKDLNLLDNQRTYGEPFQMNITITGENIKKDMPYTVITKNTGDTGEDKTVDADGQIYLEIDLKDTEWVIIEKIPHGSRFQILEDPKTNHGFQVTYQVDGKDTDTGIVPARTNLEQEFSIASVVTNQEKTAEVTIPVTKFIANPDGEKHTYEFALVEVDAAGNAIQGGESQKTPITLSGKDKDFSFVLDYRTTDLNGYAVDPLTNIKSRKYYYQITETTPDDIYSVDSDQSKYIVEVTLSGETNVLEAKITNIWKDGMELSADGKISFTNILLGSMTLKKSVPNLGFYEPDFKFTITAACSGTYPAVKNGKETTVTFNNGVAKVWLGQNDSLTIYGLHHGLEVNVVESTHEHFATYTKVDSSRSRNTEKAEFEVSTAGVECHYKNYYIEDLPQTGQLKWPILALGVLGIGFLGFGALTKKRKKNGK